MNPQKKLDALPFVRRTTQVQSPTLPLPPPSDAVTTEAFLTWIANMPKGRVEEVRQAISGITEKPEVAAILNQQLLCLPCVDVGRHLLLLSTIGELREVSSVVALEKFIWFGDEQILGAIPATQKRCDFSTPGMLQARAAEMMIWVLQGKDDELVMRIIRNHPSRLVRMAAIDSYLFQCADSPDAIKLLQDHVSAADQPMIGLPRFGAHTDPKTFASLTAKYDAAQPSDIPPPRKPETSVFLREVCMASAIVLGFLLALKLTRITTTKRRISHVR